MNIRECETVKQCLMWAEQEWPGFWEFANQKDLTEEDIINLAKSIEENNQKFQTFCNKLLEVGKIDKSKEALALLMKGAGAFVNLENKLNEYKKTKR